MSPAAIQIIALALQAAPQLAADAAALFDTLRGDLSDAEKAQIDAALDAAHAALQNAQPAAPGN